MLSGFSSRYLYSHSIVYYYIVYIGSGQKKNDSRNRLRMSHAALKTPILYRNNNVIILYCSDFCVISRAGAK